MPVGARTGQVLYLTHPQVAIDPAVPVPEWPLTALGRGRAEKFAANWWLTGVRAIYSSVERKAVDTGRILADRLGLPLAIVEAMHENDRSATGYLPPEQFEAVADRFFAEPETSVRGWERAVDAQARIATCVRGILERDETTGDILLAGHGGVGALLLAQLLGAPISRELDQPATGGGNLFAFRRGDLGVIHVWRSMEGVA